MGRQAKLWGWSTGAHGSRVRVAERIAGGPIYAMTPLAGGGWKKVSLGHRDKERAMQEASHLAAQRGRGDEPLERLTVAQMFDLYSRSVVPTQCPRHQEGTRRSIELWTRFLSGTRVVETIGPSEWEAFQRVRTSGEVDGRGQVVAKAEDRRPVGARTIARELKVLRSACRRATIERTQAGGFILPYDPTRGLALPAERNPKRPTADTERYEKLQTVAHLVKMRRGWGRKATWEPSYLPTLLLLAGETGRRISAILALRWGDWLPSEGTHGALRWRAASDKLRKDWTVPVSAPVETELRLERERRAAEPEDGLVFPSLNDASKSVSLPVVSAWLRQAEKLAGLTPMDQGAWHPFRRMFACQRKHLPVKDVATAGGWSDTATLQNVYQASDQETLEAVVSGGKRLKGVRR